MHWKGISRYSSSRLQVVGIEHLNRHILEQSTVGRLEEQLLFLMKSEACSTFANDCQALRALILHAGMAVMQDIKYVS